MKKILAVFIFIFFYAGLCVTANSQDAKVVAYYFHGDFRCSNCYKIEKYSKEAIDKYFARELESGELEYKIVNVDEKLNEHFAKDYKLYTKSLVLSRVKAGEEVGYKNLEKVWNYLGDKEAFYNYVREEVAKFLEAGK